MNKITSSKHEWIFWILLIIPFLYSAITWNQLPDQVPTHFNIHGEPDQYSSRVFGALALPVFGIILYFILRYIPLIDPRKKNYEYFGKSYFYIRLSITGFMLLIYFFSMQASLGHPDLFHPRIMFTAVFILFALLGNYMRNIRPNFFVGIRTPWTLDNAEVWKKTHELGGKFFFYGGLIGAACSLMMSDQNAVILFFVIMVIITMVPVVYSYFEFQKIKKETNKE